MALCLNPIIRGLEGNCSDSITFCSMQTFDLTALTQAKKKDYWNKCPQLVHDQLPLNVMTYMDAECTGSCVQEVTRLRPSLAIVPPLKQQ